MAITMEVFKDVVGYEGLYKVSNLGNVKRLANNIKRDEIILKHGIDTYGYSLLVLYKEKKTKNGKCSQISRTSIHY